VAHLEVQFEQFEHRGNGDRFDENIDNADQSSPFVDSPIIIKSITIVLGIKSITIVLGNELHLEV